jgi:thioredoxin reductase (NADPH)
VAGNCLDELHVGAGRDQARHARSTRAGERRTLTVGALVALVGASPHTDWLQGKITLDADGFVLTGASLGTGLRDQDPWKQLMRDPFLLETNIPGVFAVGDVRSGGTRMAAPAVGEGGMAARFAAEHLARTTAR